MTEKILFVHGTGVRNAAFERLLALIAGKVATYLPRYEVVGCNWGDAFGARLNAGGASIPGYVDNGAAGAALEAAAMARWTLLADDPLLELRVSALPLPLGGSQGPVLWSTLVASGTAPQPRALLDAWGLAGLWPQFVSELAADTAWIKTFKSIGGTLGQLSAPASRAVVAAFLAWLRTAGQPGITGKQRDDLADALQALFGASLGVKDWFLDKLTNYAAARRGMFSDASGGPLGDILRYQARGETLRNFIGERVRQTEATVILAHSLGGIAAFDWLAGAERDIAALVTVGSQATFLYEIDALASRGYGDGLPREFRAKWLNIYDPRDFLSYAGEGVFPGRVQDVEVDNGQPFPASHSAYWQNDAQVWTAIDQFLP